MSHHNTLKAVSRAMNETLRELESIVDGLADGPHPSMLKSVTVRVIPRQRRSDGYSEPSVHVRAQLVAEVNVITPIE